MPAANHAGCLGADLGANGRVDQRAHRLSERLVDGAQPGDVVGAPVRSSRTHLVITSRRPAPTPRPRGGRAAAGQFQHARDAGVPIIGQRRGAPHDLGDHLQVLARRIFMHGLLPFSDTVKRQPQRADYEWVTYPAERVTCLMWLDV